MAKPGSHGAGTRNLGRFKVPRFNRPFAVTHQTVGPARTEPFTLKAPDPPAGWPGTLPEWEVYWYLTKQRKLIEYEDFQYQKSALGGRYVPGGQVVDFVIWGPPVLGLYINGLYWHAQSYINLQVTEQAKLQLETYGIKALSLWEDDLASRLGYTVDQALDYQREVSDRPLNY